MFNCKIYHTIGDEEFILMDKNYKGLKEMSKDLGLTYQQVADLSSRREKKKYQQFKYFPTIDITRISAQENRDALKTFQEIWDKNN